MLNYAIFFDFFRPVVTNFDNLGHSIVNIGDLNNDEVDDIVFDDIVVGADGDNEGCSNRGAVHIMFMVGTPSTTPSTTSSGESGCKIIVIQMNLKIMILLEYYQVMCDVDTNDVILQAYSTCLFHFS